MDNSAQIEFGIFIALILQMFLGNLLFKKIDKNLSAQSFSFMKKVHRVLGIIIYIVTKIRIFFLSQQILYTDLKTGFYLVVLIYCFVWCTLYGYLFFVYWRVQDFEFNGPYLVSSFRNNQYLKELLFIIENGDYEVPPEKMIELSHLDGQSDISGNISISSENESQNSNHFDKSQISLDNPRYKKTQGFLNKDKKFFETPTIQNLSNEIHKEISSSSFSSDNQHSSQEKSIISLCQDGFPESNINKMIPWTLIEDKVFDLRKISRIIKVIYFWKL